MSACSPRAVMRTHQQYQGLSARSNKRRVSRDGRESPLERNRFGHRRFAV
jgi:hypothetical protein